ncbi:hypothetical protein RA267_28065, partial [Pseudomonas syringae pv. tagetis]|uniref:hypothetical protein n=1 Tax=Pseudomonas syringae group genomosp. 7 TaxID=251699 RepID=UPI00376FAB82
FLVVFWVGVSLLVFCCGGGCVCCWGFVVWVCVLCGVFGFVLLLLGLGGWVFELLMWRTYREGVWLAGRLLAGLIYRGLRAVWAQRRQVE